MTKYEHSYSKVYKEVDWWKSKEFYVHKSCKGYSAKTLTSHTHFTTREIERIKNSRFCLVMYTQRQLQ